MYLSIVYSTLQSNGVDFNYELTTCEATENVSLKTLINRIMQACQHTSAPHTEMFGSCNPGLTTDQSKFQLKNHFLIRNWNKYSGNIWYYLYEE